MYEYRPAAGNLYVVGLVGESGTWYPLKSYSEETIAAKQVALLNLKPLENKAPKGKDPKRCTST